MKNIKSIIFLLTLSLAGLIGCKDFLGEETDVNYPRPFSPTGIEANLDDLNDISLKWNQVRDVKSYTLELYANDSLEFIAENLIFSKSDILPEEVPFHFIELEKNIQYSVRVKAIRTDGTESKWEGYAFKTKAKAVKITEWNFSKGELLEKAMELGNNASFTENITVNGLTMHVISTSSMRFVEFAATEVDGYNFSWYLDLMGAGSAQSVAENLKTRCVSFEVTEPCIITVYGNSTAGRVLEAYTSTGVIGTTIVNNKADPPAKMSINWTGGKERIYVRSQGSGINLYLIRVAVGEVYVPNTVSDLTNLTISEGTMTPAFNGGTYDYTINVPYSTQSVIFTPTLAHVKQTINGSLTATITSATTEHRLEVIAEDGITTSTYIFTINREASSNDATLKTLSGTGGGTWTPTFTPNVFDYVYTVANDIETVTFTAAKNHPYATFAPQTLTASNLAVGNNGPYQFTVISENQTVSNIYRITVKREPPATTPSENKEWNITQLVADGLLFDGDIAVETTVDDLTILPTVNIDANAKTVNGIAFAKRLKLNGTGSTTSRALKFNVSGACTLSVYALSSSSTSDRVLNVDNGTGVVGTINALGTSTSMETFNYTGGSGTLYLYSPDSGVNIYYVKVVYP
jgi:hypothetical protein